MFGEIGIHESLKIFSLKGIGSSPIISIFKYINFMIQKGSVLNVIDNSGANKVCCIQVFSGYRKRYGFVGDITIVSVKSLKSKRRESSKIKKGDVLKALIVRTKIVKKNYNFQETSFFENAVVLLSRQNKILGTRIFGSLPEILRYGKYLRVVSLSSGILN